MRFTSALSLVELLIALALLVLLVGIGFATTSPGLAGDAESVAAHLRFERLTRVVGTDPRSGAWCLLPIEGGIRARVVAWPPRGLQFTPDGLPRTCDGGGVGNTTILLEHRGRQAAVIVSSLGRVRWEMR